MITLARTTIAIALLLGLAAPAVADSYPSTAWVEECSKSPKVAGDNVMTCTAYLHGLINALAIWQFYSPETALVCFPPDLQTATIRNEIMPQARRDARPNISASVLLTRLLSQRLPCGRTS
jgi:Rap1a immunity proteins